VNRIWLVSVSPLTNYYTCSCAGDFFAGELRKTGFDGIQITGKSKKTVYFSVINGKARLNDASFMWGRNTQETTELLKKRHKGEVASIGIAGENLVKFACVNVGVRQAGRGGIGAVLGSKKLKAIVVKGNERIQPSELYGETLKEIKRTRMGWKKAGTLDLMEIANEADFWPSYNWRKSHFDGEAYWKDFKKHVTGYHTCFSCPIACGRNMKSKYGDTSDGPEYETVWAFGPQCSNSDIDVIIRANRLCDLYGLDTIATGGVIGWFLECAERGLVDYQLTGSEQILELIGDIARREPEHGSMLAEGTRRASKMVPGSESFAINQAGMELPAYDPRTLWGMLLTYTFGPRHGCHQKAWTVFRELKMGMKGRVSIKGKAKMVSELLDETAVLDAGCGCNFVDPVNLERVAKVMGEITGKKYNAKKLMGIGKKIVDLERRIDVMRGLKKSDDTLPRRILEEQTIAKGKRIVVGKENFERMKKEFYKIRKW
jgi:aldehyde:ferredoxin oxidoreductase